MMDSARRRKYTATRDAVALLIAWMRDDEEAQRVLTSEYRDDATVLVAGLLNLSAALAVLRCEQLGEEVEGYLMKMAKTLTEEADK